MKKHLERQFGVSHVEVSLIDGKVEITPKADGSIDPIQLLKATYDSGVSIAEMSVIARGKIVNQSEGRIALQVNDSQSFAIESSSLSESLKNMAGPDTFVTLRGLLYQKQANQKKQTVPASLNLTILEILKKE